MKRSSSPRTRLFEEFILKSWWAILFILISLFAFDRALIQRKKEENQLRIKRDTLICEKTLALAQQEELKRQISSHEDGAWIEMTLMRCLGLVPEGQTKIYFLQKK